MGHPRSLEKDPKTAAGTWAATTEDEPRKCWDYPGGTIIDVGQPVISLGVCLFDNYLNNE